MIFDNNFRILRAYSDGSSTKTFVIKSKNHEFTIYIVTNGVDGEKWIIKKGKHLDNDRQCKSIIHYTNPFKDKISYLLHYFNYYKCRNEYKEIPGQIFIDNKLLI